MKDKGKETGIKRNLGVKEEETTRKEGEMLRKTEKRKKRGERRGDLPVKSICCFCRRPMPEGLQLSNLALEKLRQEDCQKFKTSLGYTGRRWLILT